MEAVESGCSHRVHSNARPFLIRPSISERPPEKRVSNVPKALTERLPGSLTRHVDEMNQVVGLVILYSSSFSCFCLLLAAQEVKKLEIVDRQARPVSTIRSMHGTAASDLVALHCALRSPERGAKPRTLWGTFTGWGALRRERVWR